MENSLSSDDLYRQVISLFSDVKLLDGPLGLSSSLRRHPRLVAWVKEYQKELISSFESSLD